LHDFPLNVQAVSPIHSPNFIDRLLRQWYGSGQMQATADSLRNSLRAWFNFCNGYDPLFTWWTDAPYKAADKALQNYVTFR